MVSGVKQVLQLRQLVADASGVYQHAPEVRHAISDVTVIHAETAVRWDLTLGVVQRVPSLLFGWLPLAG